jgi:hypothetical protein
MRATAHGREADPSRSGRRERAHRLQRAHRRKALKPGSYRAVIVATDAAGTAGRPVTLAFRVVRR